MYTTDMDFDDSTQVVVTAASMARCARCCLYKSMKLVNLIMLLFGIGIIIYSLWMDKKWHMCLSDLLPNSHTPKPWFIYACYGVGIAVSLSTLCGYMIVNYIGSYTLCAYIFIVCCLVFLEVAVIVIIFFKMDLVAEIDATIDGEHHKAFESFVTLHVKISRVFVLLILAAQINAVALAVIFWTIGMEPRQHCNQLNVSHFTQSFLVPSIPDPDDTSRQACSCRRCENLQAENSQGGLLSYTIGIIREQFQRRNYAN